MAQVWTVGFDDGYEVSLPAEFPGFDRKAQERVEYIDITHDGGEYFEPGRLGLGRALKPDFLPKEFYWGGSANRMPDVKWHLFILVSDKAKEIIERLEPGVHQFFPISTVTRGKKPGPRMYIFNICNRIDGIDKGLTTHENPYGGLYLIKKGGEFIFNQSQIGRCHVWFERRTILRMFLSDAMKTAFEEADISGLKYIPHRAV